MVTLSSGMSGSRINNATIEKAVGKEEVLSTIVNLHADLRSL